MEKRNHYVPKSVTLTLKPIGRGSNNKTSFKQSKFVNSNNIYRNKQQFIDQQIPFLQNQNHDEQIIKKSKKMLFSLIQDPRKTSFSYKKFLLMEKILFLLTFISFFLMLIKTELQQNLGQDLTTISGLISISTFSLIFCLFLRYLASFELKIYQKKVFVMNFSQQDSILLIFLTKSGNDIYWLLLQILFMLPHPNIFLTGKSVSMFESYDEIYYDHEINDIMALISLFRVYIILRSLVNITIYSSPRSARLCQQNGVDHNLLYSIKCILNQQPLRAIFIVFLVSVMFLGVGLKITEGVLYLHNNLSSKTGFQVYSNCFWCVFITMGTIGYGDYYPKTLLGRLVIFATALTGVVLSSLLIVSLSSYLQMQPSQSKSHITLLRLNEQQKLKTQASKALCATIQLFKKMTSKDQNKGIKIKSVFSNLKRKIDLVKIRNRKVKCLVDTDNILEEMNRLFQILKDNLRDIYQNQVLMKSVLQKIKVFQKGTRSVKLSFAKQMKKAIQVL